MIGAFNPAKGVWLRFLIASLLISLSPNAFCLNTKHLSQFRAYKARVAATHAAQEAHLRQMIDIQKRFYGEGGQILGMYQRQLEHHLRFGPPRARASDTAFLAEIAAEYKGAVRELETLPAYSNGQTFAVQLLGAPEARQMSSTITELKRSLPGATVERWTASTSIDDMISQTKGYDNIVLMGHGVKDWGTVQGGGIAIGAKDWRGQLGQMIEGKNVVLLGCNTGHCYLNDGVNPFHSAVAAIQQAGAKSVVATLNQVSKGADAAFLRMMRVSDGTIPIGTSSGRMGTLNEIISHFTGNEGPHFRTLIAP